MTKTPARPFPVPLPEALPQVTPYAEVLGVEFPVIEKLRSLHRRASAGDLTLQAWREGHEQLLGDRLTVDRSTLDDLCECVGVAVSEALDADLGGVGDLAALEANLRLLAGPDPEAELEQVEDALASSHAEAVVEQLRSRREVLRRMLGAADLAPWADGRPETEQPAAQPGLRTRATGSARRRGR